MVPAVGDRYPVNARSNEVLPEPLAPRMAQCSPRATRQSIRSRITASRSTRSSLTSITGLADFIAKFCISARQCLRHMHELLRRAVFTDHTANGRNPFDPGWGQALKVQGLRLRLWLSLVRIPSA